MKDPLMKQKGFECTFKPVNETNEENLVYQTKIIDFYIFLQRTIKIMAFNIIIL